MPLYEYRCKQCGYRYEKIQKFGAQPETACPKCGSGLERPLTAPALQFKGAGWYVNDYAPKSASGDKSGDSKPPSESKSGDSKSSSESKPATESKPAESAPKPASTPSTSSSTT